MLKNIAILNKGAFYRNEFWFSEAYLSLNKGSRDLLQCFLTEIRKKPIKKSKRQSWIIMNNGEISFTALQFRERCGYEKQTYINARNQLITNGIIIQTYQGGNCKGDMAQYKLLCTDDIIYSDQRWRQYPGLNWSNDIPKSIKQRVGSKTQWQKGECGRNSKSTLLECTLKEPIDPIAVDPKK
ncbi:hypothetical protein ACFL4H_01710 [Candidatus Neomarinimicrobiota bacterium]